MLPVSNAALHGCERFQKLLLCSYRYFSPYRFLIPTRVMQEALFVEFPLPIWYLFLK